MTKHIPVLLEETIGGLHLKNGDTVVDATLGGGGHTLRLLEKVSPAGRVIALDADAAAIARFRERIASDGVARQALGGGRLVLARANFARLDAELDRLGVGRLDAALADLGFSSDQIEDGARGFSFLQDGSLDMRLDQTEGRTARDLVMTAPPDDLERLFRESGDEPEARRLTAAIVATREREEIATTRALAQIVEAAYPKGKRARMKIHPATRVFQALRIAVNREDEHLEAFLRQAAERLNPGGRLAVIAFHSGEDRIVKRFFRDEARGCVCPTDFPICRCGRSARMRRITGKAIVPGVSETARNPRARSARLRIAEKI